MGLETRSYILRLAGVDWDFWSMSFVYWRDWNSKDGLIFQHITNNIVESSVFQRYWSNDKFDVTTVQNRLCEKGARFDHQEDHLKIALALFVERFLFGADYRKTVSPWLFTLVEDIKQFNSFPWGKFVFQMTLHYLNNASRSPKPGKDQIQWLFYGFPIVLQVGN